MFEIVNLISGEVVEGLKPPFRRSSKEPFGLKVLDIGFRDIIHLHTNFVKDPTTKDLKWSKVAKGRKKENEEMEGFRKKLKPNTTLRNKINRMVDFQDDFYDYEDFYVLLKWISWFDDYNDYMSQFDDETRMIIEENYKKLDPMSDLTSFFG